MWLSFYNQEGISDTLLLTSGTASRYDVAIETKNGVTRVFDEKTNTVIGYNIAGISNHIRFEKAGQQFLSEEEQATVKTLIQEAGFDGEALDLSPKDTLVVGYVETCVPHEDSDHLHVTQTRVSQDTVLQIVCGAPNVKAGQKVVVALSGAMMPSGLLIKKSKLRGVESNGMLCSKRELGLPQEEARGILVLGADTKVGTRVKDLNLK